METCGGASGAALETTRHNGANDDAKLVGVQLGNVHYITRCSEYLPRHILYYSRVFRCQYNIKFGVSPHNSKNKYGFSAYKKKLGWAGWAGLDGAGWGLPPVWPPSFLLPDWLHPLWLPPVWLPAVGLPWRARHLGASSAHWFCVAICLPQRYDDHLALLHNMIILRIVWVADSYIVAQFNVLYIICERNCLSGLMFGKPTNLS